MFDAVYINHIVYADDTILLAPSPAALQKLINSCCDFASKHGLIYNETKSKFMCIKPTCIKNLYIPNVTLNGSLIRRVHTEKYLGFNFNDNCLDNDHIVHEMRNMYARGSMLIRNFIHCSTDVKVKLYQSYCSNVYCCGLISAYHKTVLNKLRVAFNKIFKRLLCKPSRSSASSLFVNMNVDNFLVRRRKLIFSLYNKVRQSGNSIIQCIVDSSFFNSCGLKREWDSILHLT